MGYTFDAYLAGRIATEPTLGETKDARPWTKFGLAVDDRIRNADTGEWGRRRRSSMAWWPFDVGKPLVTDGCAISDSNPEPAD